MKLEDDEEDRGSGGGALEGGFGGAFGGSLVRGSGVGSGADGRQREGLRREKRKVLEDWTKTFKRSLLKHTHK